MKTIGLYQIFNTFLPYDRTRVFIKIVRVFRNSSSIIIIIMYTYSIWDAQVKKTTTKTNKNQMQPTFSKFRPCLNMVPARIICTLRFPSIADCAQVVCHPRTAINNAGVQIQRLATRGSASTSRISTAYKSINLHTDLHTYLINKSTIWNEMHRTNLNFCTGS